MRLLKMVARHGGLGTASRLGVAAWLAIALLAGGSNLGYAQSDGALTSLLTGVGGVSDRMGPARGVAADLSQARVEGGLGLPPGLGLYMSARYGDEDRANRFQGIFANIDPNDFGVLSRVPVGGQVGWSTQDTGLLLGSDYQVNDWLNVGGFFDYGNSRRLLAADLGQSETNIFSLGVTATAGFDAFYITASGSYGFGETDIDRKVNRRPGVTFDPVTRTLVTGPALAEPRITNRGNPDLRMGEVAAVTGYDFSFGGLSVGPYAGVTWMRTIVDGFTERGGASIGASANYIVEEQTITSLKSRFGIQSSYAISTEIGVITPAARIEYVREHQDDPREVRYRFAEAPGDVLIAGNTADPDRHVGSYGFSLSGLFEDGINAFVDFESLFAHRYLDRYQITAGVRKTF